MRIIFIKDNYILPGEGTTQQEKIQVGKQRTIVKIYVRNNYNLIWVVAVEMKKNGNIFKIILKYI